MREKTRTITIRVTEAEYEALETLARAHRKPITTYVTQSIRASLRQGDPAENSLSADLLQEITATRRGVHELQRSFQDFIHKFPFIPDIDVPDSDDGPSESTNQPLVENG